MVSDMTCFYQKGTRYEWTYMLDTFNNEIISYALTDKYGDNIPYYKCSEDLKGKLTDTKKPVILHTDQGSVYSSKAFKEAHNQFKITRSMSRVGTPTDNPIIEAFNGWIKDELKVDFDLKHMDNVFKLIDDYVLYFNNERPAYALNYKTPIQFKIEQGF